MSRYDRDLKDILEFFCKDGISGSIDVDLYSWRFDTLRRALNNLKNKGLLTCRKSELCKNTLVYTSTEKLKLMLDTLKPLGRAQRLRYVKEHSI